jgi:putative redox protein
MSQADLKAALEKTIAAIQSDPAAARATVSARTAQQHGTRCEARVRTHAPLIVDEPPELGGTDAGMNPVELVLSALGTCQEIMYAAYAAVGNIPLEGVRVRVRGDLDLRGLFELDDDVPAGCGRIQFATEIDSPADEATIRKLADTVERHCPVLDVLTRPVPIEGSVSLNGNALERAAQLA